ncbi:MAG: anaerobic ribonucleoside-triphosphate reductase [Patescibacteria group bacterium]|jgi:anaerobic ribonucleoside-triphosphate reductase
MVHNILKRDGSTETFTSEKILDAIWAAVRNSGSGDKDDAERLTALVVSSVQDSFGEYGVPEVEAIQNLIEKTLITEDMHSVAKAFILYRKRRDDLRNLEGVMQSDTVIDNYVSTEGSENLSLDGLQNFMSREMISQYWIRKVYDDSLVKLHLDGDIFLHDLGSMGVYRANWNLLDLLQVGFRGGEEDIVSSPARHFRVALGQIASFFFALKNEAVGVQSLSHFDTLLAPFVRADGLIFTDVKQALQEFIFSISNMMGQDASQGTIHLGMDLVVPDSLREVRSVLGGVMQTETYKCFSHEMLMIQRAFCSCISEGDSRQKIFTNPVARFSIPDGFNFMSNDYKPMWEMAAKYGNAHFVNASQINKQFSMYSENEKISPIIESLQANSLHGSIGSVTLNLARLGYISTSEDDFFSRLDFLLSSAYNALTVRRKTLEDFTARGLYGHSSFYLRSVKQKFGQYWKQHASTISLLGMHESILNFLKGEGITTNKGRDFALKVMEFISERLVDFSTESGHVFSLEPCVDYVVARRLAAIDKERFGRIITGNEESLHLGHPAEYTCGSNLPESYSSDLFTAIGLQEDILNAFTTEGYFDSVTEQPLTVDQLRGSVAKVFTGSSVAAFKLSPMFYVCPVHGYLPGAHLFCSDCEDEADELEDIAEEEKQLDRAEEHVREELIEQGEEEEFSGEYSVTLEQRSVMG